MVGEAARTPMTPGRSSARGPILAGRIERFWYRCCAIATRSSSWPPATKEFSADFRQSVHPVEGGAGPHFEPQGICPGRAAVPSELTIRRSRRAGPQPRRAAIEP